MLLENEDCDPHEQRFEQMLQKYDVGNPWGFRLKTPRKIEMAPTNQGGILGVYLDWKFFLSLHFKPSP